VTFGADTPVVSLWYLLSTTKKTQGNAPQRTQRKKPVFKSQNAKVKSQNSKVGLPFDLISEPKIR
jgi:hypothetical protein